MERPFQDGLRDIAFAERTALQGLEWTARGTHPGALRGAFAMSGRQPRRKTSAAMDGIAEEIMEHCKRSPALDAGLLAVAQANEHCEIARC